MTISFYNVTAGRTVFAFAIAAALLGVTCDKNPQTIENPPKEWSCVVPSDSDINFTKAIGCEDDFWAIASEPLDASISGAISAKTVIDLYDEAMPLYFQNSKKYEIHWEFASENLSIANGRQLVPPLGEFNNTEYSSPNRRFILGAVIYYEGPKIWTYEIAPTDNASAEMIATAYNKICDSAFFGRELYFHPSSEGVQTEADKLPDSIKMISTEQLYNNIDYQPLNLGASMGRLKFVTARELEDSVYVGFRDIIVLDAVPNDISVTSGIITQTFQTPLAHINVLSRNRGTPNMGLRGAFNDSLLRSYEGKWVRLEVGAFEWKISEVTQEEADAWWEEKKPASIGIAAMDTLERELKNVEDIISPNEDRSNLHDEIKRVIPAYGGKASHFSAFPHMNSDSVPYPKAFAIPVYYYWQFMEQNGFNTRVDSLLADAAFKDDPAIRDNALEALRDSMENAPLGSAYEAKLAEKLTGDFAKTSMRFRSSTNAEDLDGFTGAGLYTSKTASDPTKMKDVRKAIRTVYSSVWYFRAFEERSYRSIDHKSVGMALLVHQSYPDEEASSVAITRNIFDQKNLLPGYYINVQKGDVSVVLPDAQVTTDQILYHMDENAVQYLAHSNLVDSGTTVLTLKQIHTLGMALKCIHDYFQPCYGADPTAWYAMDTEFKFDQPIDNPDGEPVLFMKQARPYPPPF